MRHGRRSKSQRVRLFEKYDQHSKRLLPGLTSQHTRPRSRASSHVILCVPHLCGAAASTLAPLAMLNIEHTQHPTARCTTISGHTPSTTQEVRGTKDASSADTAIDMFRHRDLRRPVVGPIPILQLFPLPTNQCPNTYVQHQHKKRGVRREISPSCNVPSEPLGFKKS